MSLSLFFSSENLSSCWTLSFLCNIVIDMLWLMSIIIQVLNYFCPFSSFHPFSNFFWINHLFVLIFHSLLLSFICFTSSSHAKYFNIHHQCIKCILMWTYHFTCNCETFPKINIYFSFLPSSSLFQLFLFSFTFYHFQ